MSSLRGAELCEACNTYAGEEDVIKCQCGWDCDTFVHRASARCNYVWECDWCSVVMEVGHESDVIEGKPYCFSCAVERFKQEAVDAA